MSYILHFLLLLCLGFSQVYAKEIKNPILWQSIALGAGAEMRLYTEDEILAKQVIEKVEQEIERLESIFSLYREDSALSRLNKQGYLENPPVELLGLLVQSKEIYSLTKGRFDPSIQVLWNLYAGQKQKNPQGVYVPPTQEQLAKTLELIDFSAVKFNSQIIQYEKVGLQVSLNGIAQGFITDKVMEIIRSSGIRRALIDIGEIRAMDLDKEGKWQVGIRNPKLTSDVLFNISLQNGAVSTSGGYGTIFDEDGKFTHLFDPKTGRNQTKYQSITVMAPTATLADALSTALAVSTAEEIEEIKKSLPQIKVWVIKNDVDK